MAEKRSEIEITGGPHAKNMKIMVDGEEVIGLYHADVQLDVNDAVKVTLSHFMTAVIKVTADVVENYKVAVYRVTIGDDGTVDQEKLAEEAGNTISEALNHCASRLMGVS